ncbi:MAG: type II toxin-antitoxin system RelE/ParE family toxin [Verrucomicrobiota bacterium]
MRIVVLPEAADEFGDAAHYDDEQETGLGQRYRDEVDRHIRWIAMHPDLPRIRPGGYRRVNLRVFPYSVGYFVHQQSIWVLAIAHGHRKPGYWSGRRLTRSPR